MLTQKQYELLVFIEESLEAKEVAPSFDEMKDALNLKSKSGIHRLVSALEERGFIRRLPNKARALEVIRSSRKMEPKSNNSVPPYSRRLGGFSPNVIPGNFVRSSSLKNKNYEDSIEIPLYGKIAAGNPIEAISDPSEKIMIPPHLVKDGDHYALQVAGDSMIEEGIFDGDTAIIERCDTAENGAIVVALIENEEVTLKKLRKRNHSIALEPANSEYETRIFGPDQVKLQGRLVGLMRKY
ncbi:MAG: repressor LexA [Rhodospirillaceae bacterium]|nr:repressor LexA [Rhodospirillaceae bacterium]